MDYLDTASWLPHAQKLRPGERRRIAHDCGAGKTLLIQSTDKGLDAWCWRCALGGFHAAPEESWQDRIKRLAQERGIDQAIQQSITLPTPKNVDPRTWPLFARVWLYKAGMTNDEIVAHGFYYHPPTSRVVMPVWQDNALAYWQARGFSTERAKYLNPSVDKSRLVSKYHPVHPVVQQLPLTLTEDILSAIRVSTVTESWSLLGTVLHPSVATQIIQTKRRVAIWLDPDGAGVKGTLKVYRQLHAYGIDCRVINSEKDPKYYSSKEIECQLS